MAGKRKKVKIVGFRVASPLPGSGGGTSKVSPASTGPSKTGMGRARASVPGSSPGPAVKKVAGFKPQASGSAVKKVAGFKPQAPGTSSAHRHCDVPCVGVTYNGLWIHSDRCPRTVVRYYRHHYTLENWVTRPCCPHGCKPYALGECMTHDMDCPFWKTIDSGTAWDQLMEAEGGAPEPGELPF